MLKKIVFFVVGAMCYSSTFVNALEVETPELNNGSPVTSFAVIGDYGDNSRDERHVAELVEDAKPDFVLTVGDNNYSNGCWDTIDKNIGKYYSKFIGNYQGKYGDGSVVNRFFPTLGNHDWYAKSKCLRHGTLPYLQYFSLPGNGRYYDFQKGSVHFFALDSDSKEPDGNKKYSSQYYWLKNKLKKSTACFKVVYFHHAAYSSGEHGSEGSMQWDFARLGVDVVMAGHDHHYERIERNGIVYFVNGAGGADLGDIEDKVHGSKYRYTKRHGFMMVRANDEHMVLSFINENKHIKDRTVLTKLCQ